METTLYYTLSTIAQTLAAAIALLGAFVLYRLQGLNAIAAVAAQRVRDNCSSYAGANAEHLNTLFETGAFDAIAKDVNSRECVASVVIAMREQLNKALETRAALRRDFSPALWSVVTMIALSVLGLALTPWLTACASLAYAALAIAVVGCFGSLVLCARLVRDALAERDV